MREISLDNLGNIIESKKECKETLLKNFTVIYADNSGNSDKMNIKRIEKIESSYEYKPKIIIPEPQNITVSNTPSVNIYESKELTQNNFNKWWNSYLTLTKKLDTDGRGYEHSDIEDTSDAGCLYYINEFTSNAPVSEYPKILDIGAGDGGETYVLKNRGYNVTGITIGEDNVTKAKEQYNIDLINTDMNCLNFPINSFDGIMMIQAFEHFLSPFIACIEMWRVLRVGGLCYIDVPSPSDLPMWNLGHTNLLHPDQLKNMFSMCGFEVHKNLSTQHRPRFIFRKLSISKIRNWEQLRYIINARNEVKMKKIYYADIPIVDPYNETIDYFKKFEEKLINYYNKSEELNDIEKNNKIENTKIICKNFCDRTKTSKCRDKIFKWFYNIYEYGCIEMDKYGISNITTPEYILNSMKESLKIDKNQDLEFCKFVNNEFYIHMY